jgi:hypothetical protein
MNNIKAILNLLEIAEKGSSVVRFLFPPGRALKMSKEAKYGPLLVPYIFVYTPLLRATMDCILFQKNFPTSRYRCFWLLDAFKFLYVNTCLVMCD